MTTVSNIGGSSAGLVPADLPPFQRARLHELRRALSESGNRIQPDQNASAVLQFIADHLAVSGVDRSVTLAAWRDWLAPGVSDEDLTALSVGAGSRWRANEAGRLIGLKTVARHFRKIRTMRPADVTEAAHVAIQKTTNARRRAIKEAMRRLDGQRIRDFERSMSGIEHIARTEGLEEIQRSVDRLSIDQRLAFKYVLESRESTVPHHREIIWGTVFSRINSPIDSDIYGIMRKKRPCTAILHGKDALSAKLCGLTMARAASDARAAIWRFAERQLPSIAPPFREFPDPVRYRLDAIADGSDWCESGLSDACLSFHGVMWLLARDFEKTNPKIAERFQLIATAALRASSALDLAGDLISKPPPG
jgi:hypothetical protein